jgi:hypothetical protein
MRLEVDCIIWIYYEPLHTYAAVEVGRELGSQQKNHLHIIEGEESYLLFKI